MPGEETQFQVQKPRPFLKGRLNNSKLRWVTNSASYKSRKSTSKSSQIIPVFIQTWITRVLYTQERSRWLQMFCTMFFWLWQNFLKPHVRSPITSRSAKTKFQHLETWWRAEKPMRSISMKSPEYQPCKITRYRKYAMGTKCPNLNAMSRFNSDRWRWTP